VKLILIILMLSAAAGGAAAESIPLPRPRPAPPLAANPAKPVEPATEAQPSACRLRLTTALAIAPSLPAIDLPGGCAVEDVVRLEAIVLKEGSHVAVTPPATLACSMAEAIVRWVREDVAAAVEGLGAPLRSVDNYASFDCRGRNNIVGAKLSEHGHANALDIRSFKLTDGKLVRLVDPHVARDFREAMKKSVCARFSTVLGPGSDGYHEDHVHVDLMDRAPGRFKMCQWDVRDPEPEASTAAVSTTVPLPRPRPTTEPNAGGKL
jgi:hypothetical protein